MFAPNIRISVERAPLSALARALVPQGHGCISSFELVSSLSPVGSSFENSLLAMASFFDFEDLDEIEQASGRVTDVLVPDNDTDEPIRAVARLDGKARGGVAVGLFQKYNDLRCHTRGWHDLGLCV